MAAVMGPDDPFFEDSMRILDEAKAGRMRLVVSSLAASEAADVMRRRIKAGCRCADESGGERKAVDAKAAAAVKDLVGFIDIPKASRITGMLEGIAEAQPDLVRLHQKLPCDQGHTPQARRGGTDGHEGLGRSTGFASRRRALRVRRPYAPLTGRSRRSAAAKSMAA